MTMPEPPEKLGSLSPRAQLPLPPFFMIGGLMVLIVASWIPLVVFARARVDRGPDTRVHLTQDMDNQPKYKAQDASTVFADGRAMRLPIEGTVARGQLQEDDQYYRGYSRTVGADGKFNITFFDSMPLEKLRETTGRDLSGLIERGEQRFNIYCAVCHGQDGYGNGPVNNRAIQRQEPKWVPAANLTSETVRNRPDGHLFNTITNGIRNMAGYGAQIPTEDRWAIVAYLRALQLSQHAPASAVPPQQLDTLR